MNIQAYWDGNVGAVEYGNRRKVFTSKPVIPTVTYDTLVYSADDGVATKILGGKVTQLNPSEITAIKQFSSANAVEVPNNGTLGNFLGVATVWTSEVDLVGKTSFSVPWIYVIGDIVDCTSNDATVWNCPNGGEFDISVNLGFSGLAPNTNLQVEVLKNGVTKLVTKQFANVLNSLRIDLNNQVISTGDTLSVKLTFDKPQTCGILIPSRTYLRVDTTGNVMAKRMADYFFNTLGNMVYYSGVEMRLQLDEANKPAVVSDTWVV